MIKKKELPVTAPAPSGATPQVPISTEDLARIFNSAIPERSFGGGFFRDRSRETDHMGNFPQRKQKATPPLKIEPAAAPRATSVDYVDPGRYLQGAGTEIQGHPVKLGAPPLPGVNPDSLPVAVSKPDKQASLAALMDIINSFTVYGTAPNGQITGLKRRY